MPLSIFKNILSGLLIWLITLPIIAVMKPETSMVLINEEVGGGSLNVTNTSDAEALLYVKIYDLPDDKHPQLLVTQPITRVPAGQTQHVRFLLNSNTPLTTEHIKRVIIEGIPLQALTGENTVGLSIRQDIPIIIHPKSFPMLDNPWKELRPSEKNGILKIDNPSIYVVRLSQTVSLIPSMKKVRLNKNYILPGETLTIKTDDTVMLNNSNEIQIQSLSKYGYLVGTFKLPLAHNG